MTHKSWIAKTKKDMKSLGTYKSEYDPIITIYAHMMMQMDEYMVSDDVDQRRVEILRKEIKDYSDKLLLNPKSNGAVEVKVETKNRLEQALEKIG